MMLMVLPVMEDLMLLMVKMLTQNGHYCLKVISVEQLLVDKQVILLQL